MSALLYDMICFPELPGNLYVPNSQEIKGGVLVLHGSEGGGWGMHDLDAQMLAAHGFVALAFTWCGSASSPVEGAPTDVWDVDLDKTIDAFDWLKDRPELKGKRCAIYGVSRGAEQALILATLSAEHPELPKPDAVATLVPSDTYVGGWSWSSWRRLRRRLLRQPDLAWRFRGDYLRREGEPIRIDLYDGPVLISHGEMDTLWDEGPLHTFLRLRLPFLGLEAPRSVERSHRLEARLKEAHRHVETQYFPWEGHGLSTWGRYAQQQKLIDFLNRTITGPA